MKLVIIGAGPVGCYAGYLFAKSGYEVSIYENHPQIGLPIQCTGILTSDFDQLGFPLDYFLVNTIKRIEVFSPNEKLLINQKNYIVSRPNFDNFFADMARKAGANIFLSHNFISKEGEVLIIKNAQNKNEIKVTADIVIAADGPLSPTAKAYGFYHPERENYLGVQAIVKGKFESDLIQTYFGRGICPGLFAWVVPESSTTARVGLGAKKGGRKYFEKFIQEHNFKIKEMQAGIIPLFHPQQKLQKDNCYVLGDAAGFVKATTLGGLIPGLKQAEILVDSLVNKKNYLKELKPLFTKLRLHLFIRKMFDKFTDEDFDQFVKYANQPKVKTVLEKYTREDPLQILIKTILKEPRFLIFIKYLF